VEQAIAAARSGGFPDLVHVTGRDAAARIAEACRPGRIVVTSADYEGGGPCRVLDRRFLRKNGAAMIRSAEDREIVTVRSLGGVRRWSQ
jgi:competence protein ComEC